METDVVQTFNKALLSLQDCKGGEISKQTVFEITRTALAAVKYFKHVVFIIEKYLAKCRNDQKISVLYVIDSILRQAKKQYLHKDVFAPRFATNLRNTIENILTCDHNDKLKVVRVINLWRVNKIFDDTLIDSILQYCRALGLEVDEQKVELLVKGDKANLKMYSTPTSTNITTGKLPSTPILSSEERNEFIQMGLSMKTPPKQKGLITGAPPRTPPVPRPPTPLLEKSFDDESQSNIGISIQDSLTLISTEHPHLSEYLTKNQDAIQLAQKFLNSRIQEGLEIENRRQGNIKNILSRDFDYSDEDDEEIQRNNSDVSLQTLSRDQILNLARNLLSNMAVRKEIDEFCRPKLSQNEKSLADPIQSGFSLHTPTSSTAMPIAEISLPNLNTSGLIPKFDPSVPPPGFFHSSSLGSVLQTTPQSLKSIKDYSVERRERKREREKTRSRSREDRDLRFNAKRSEREKESRGKARSDKDRKERDSARRERNGSDMKNRSPNNSLHRHNREYGKPKDDQDIELEKERRRNGIPTKPKEAHVIIASRTLWFGRIPTTCYESDIQDAVKEIGIPEKINIVAPRGCAYVTMADRRSAFKIIDRMSKSLQVCKKSIKLDWAVFHGLKENENAKLMDYWDAKRGFAEIPYNKIPSQLNILLEGAWLDLETLPKHLKGYYEPTGLKSITNPSQTQKQSEKNNLHDYDSSTAPIASGSQLLLGATTSPSVPIFATAAFLPPVAFPPPNIPLPEMNTKLLTSPLLAGSSPLMAAAMAPFFQKIGPPIVPSTMTNVSASQPHNFQPSQPHNPQHRFSTPENPQMTNRTHSERGRFIPRGFQNDFHSKIRSFGPGRFDNQRPNWRGRGGNLRGNFRGRPRFFQQEYSQTRNRFYPPQIGGFEPNTQQFEFGQNGRFESNSETLVTTTHELKNAVSSGFSKNLQEADELSDKEVTSTTTEIIPNENIYKKHITSSEQDYDLVPPGMEDY